MLTTFSTRHVRRYMEKNEETTIEEKVKQKINRGLRSTYLKLLCSIPLDGSLRVGLLWRLDLWASMRSFNGDFPPWRCSGRQRRRGERRRHPLWNKPWKKELHQQDEPWIRSLERMLQWRKRKRGTGNQRHHHFQPSIAWQMEVESLSAPGGTVG